MDFTIQRSAFSAELGLLASVAEKESSIPILGNVLVEALDGGTVRLSASDLETGIRCQVPARIRKTGAITVPAARLRDCVRSVAGDDIRIRSTENDWAALDSGRWRAKIAGMPAVVFPHLPEAAGPGSEIGLPDLALLISRTAFAISREESRFTLKGTLLQSSASIACSVATDGHRLAFGSCAVQQGEDRFLMPRKLLAILEKLARLEDPKRLVRFSRAENHLFFEIGSRSVISRELAGTFPDYERVLAAEFPHCVSLEREALGAALRRVHLFSDERSNAFRLRIDGAGLTLFAKTDTGESEETIEAGYTGEAVEIGFNARYLLDFLDVAGTDRVSFQFKDAHSAGEFRPEGGEGGEYRYVLMPLRS